MFMAYLNRWFKKNYITSSLVIALLLRMVTSIPIIPLMNHAPPLFTILPCMNSRDTKIDRRSFPASPVFHIAVTANFPRFNFQFCKHLAQNTLGYAVVKQLRAYCGWSVDSSHLVKCCGNSQWANLMYCIPYISRKLWLKAVCRRKQNRWCLFSNKYVIHRSRTVHHKSLEKSGNSLKMILKCNTKIVLRSTKHRKKCSHQYQTVCLKIDDSSLYIIF